MNTKPMSHVRPAHEAAVIGAVIVYAKHGGDDIMIVEAKPVSDSPFRWAIKAIKFYPVTGVYARRWYAYDYGWQSVVKEILSVKEMVAFAGYDIFNEEV